MIPAAFEYVTASSLQEAVSLLGEAPGDAKILAGGHSLLPLMKLRLARPARLVDISRVDGLAYVRQQGDQLLIGPLTTHHTLEMSDLVRQKASVLAEAASRIGDVQVRNRGTIGGSLAHADPGGDLPAAILALEARLRVVGPAVERSIAAGEFFLDLLTTALAPDEVLAEIQVPIPEGRTGSAYLKFDNPASHYALVGVAALVTLAGDGTVERARVGITGVGPKAYRALDVEAKLAGGRPNEALLAEAAEAAVIGVDVQGDIHASTTYRAHMAKVYTRRALSQAVARAGGG